MLIKPITKAIRSYYAGSNSEFIFKKHDTPDYNRSETDAIHLYIHIPFCKHCCPYCPYNKILIDDSLVELFFSALDKEIELYYRLAGNITITSIYFGGGSPALFPEKIASVIDHLSKRFNIEGEICIEINPNDCVTDKLQILKSAGIKTVSIGVQSFHDSNLAIIGRKYNGIVAEKAVEKVTSLFTSVNIDLMFALPSQNMESVLDDLSKAIRLGVNQITTYPLFTFPYTFIGEYKKLKKVNMPNLHTRKAQYYSIYDTLTNQEYNQVSVWSFKKGEGSKYSSVTRDGYLGFGAGAGTHLPGGYYLNTFSVEAYISRLEKQEFPTALKFEMNQQLNDLFWLYWRFYDTRIPITDFYNRFATNGKMNRLIRFMQLSGMISKKETEFVLTRKGSFWLHLAQNYFSLSYINKIWAKAMKEDFPAEIRF